MIQNIFSLNQKWTNPFHSNQMIVLKKEADQKKEKRINKKDTIHEKEKSIKMVQD